jgi:type II secretory pathway pseudopilin PulG
MAYFRLSDVPLPEILFAVLVTGLVAAAAIPPMVYSSDTRDDQCRANIELMNTKLRLYADRHGGCKPADNAELQRMLASEKGLEVGAQMKCPCGEPYRYDPDTGTIVPHVH